MGQLLELEHFQKEDQANLAKPRPEGAKAAVLIAADDDNSNEEIGSAAHFAAVSRQRKPNRSEHCH